MPTQTLIQGPPRQAGIGLFLAIFVGGCESGTAPPPSGPGGASPAAIISDSALLDAPVAYVSFPPGSFPVGSRVTIRNRRTAASLGTVTVGGGLDPVPVPAVAGDLLAFAVDTGGAQAIGFTQSVPATSQPSVVRTEPGAGIGDAAIDVRVRVVFSEPMIRDSLINAFGVMQNGNLVEGTVEVSPDGLAATFIPTDYLLPTTEYVISVGSAITDADGSGMPETVTADFTTAGLPFTGTLAFADYLGIELINADGTNLRSLTTNPPDCICDNDPAWSPSGDRIAFTRVELDTVRWQDVYGIYVINRDGTNLVRLSPAGESDRMPTWSPDGHRIAFAHLDTLAPYESIFVMNADGTNRVQVSTLRKGGTLPAWSPDGRIAFSSDGSTAGTDIFVMDPDGTNLSALWNDSDDDWSPAWSPDGSRIAFERNGYVFLVDQDGTHLEQFTSGSAGGPAWSPDGHYIVFGQGGTMWIGSVSDRRMVPIAPGGAASWGP